MESEVSDIKYVGWVNEPGDLLERLISGEPMPQINRQTFPIEEFTETRASQITGSIGFLDFNTVATHEEFQSASSGLSEVPRIQTATAIEISIIGIEPAFLRQGYGEQLLKVLESVAKDRRIELIVSVGPEIDNEPSISWHKKRGFVKENRFFRTGRSGPDDYFSYYKKLAGFYF